MTHPDSRDDDEHRRPETIRQNRIERRRAKIREEIERNRRGEYTVPTWVLTLALVLVVAGWLALVFLS
ncbi:hypothetical protein GCM10022225_59690 [Plantactinospora mayteni]|uniref:DUF3040 domain-containing protein n=1 Tax=Plantactinospora mayteni TaxID=566021 RepID=A0ABQ4EKN7_9ACTN|nr:hypothetical protein [Plantactinospora mayteni]GIG95180.1 hypothetical protein Pma05_17530 [Plantactinospora mayteni]